MVFIHILRRTLLYTLPLTFRPAILHLWSDFISHVLHVPPFYFSVTHLFNFLFLVISVLPYRPYMFQHLDPFAPPSPIQTYRCPVYLIPSSVPQNFSSTIPSLVLSPFKTWQIFSTFLEIAHTSPSRSPFTDFNLYTPISHYIVPFLCITLINGSYIALTHIGCLS